jgi:hypothetical protein
MSTHWTLRCLLAPALAAMLLLLGCTSSEDAPPAVLTLSELSGAWAGTCQPESGATGLESRLTAVLLDSAGAMTMHEYHWNNDTCQEQPAWFQQSAGTLSLPGGTVSTTFGSAAQADLTQTYGEITLYDQVAVDTFNEAYGSGAYGIGTWAIGVTQEVTGLDMDGSPSPGTMKTLLMRAGETLFVGDDATAPPGGYPTEVRPEMGRLPTAVASAAAMAGEWSGPCREESIPLLDIPSGAALERVLVSGSTVTVSTLYFYTNYCDQSGTGGYDPAVAAVWESRTMTATMAGSATLLTELGLATGGDLVLTDHTVKPFTPEAADALAAANGGVGAWGLGAEDWIADGAVNVFATGVEFDGVTPRVDDMQISAVLRGDRFHVRANEGSDRMRLAPGNYPLTVNTQPLLRVHAIGNVSQLAGAWFEPCSYDSESGYRTGAVLISGTTATRKEWTYTSIYGCYGGVSSTFSDDFGITLMGDQPIEGRGTATRVQLESDTEVLCTLLLRMGDRLHGADPQPAIVGETTCDPTDFPADVSDGYMSRETTPVTTAPVATYLGPCRANGWESRQYLSFYGNAVAGNEIQFQYSEGGPCTGPISGQESFAGTLTFGEVVAVTEGAATRIQVQAGATTQKQIVKWMGDFFWSGDEDGPISGDGYPTQLSPQDAHRRIY